MQVISVVGYKGGSGKTTLAVNLADTFAERVPTVLIDTDPQGSAVAWIGAAEHLRVERVAEPRALARVLSRDWDGLAVVDGRPNDRTLTAVAIEHATLTLLPLRPSPLDLHANAPILEQLAGGGGLVVVCMAAPRTKDAETVRVVIGERYGVPVAETVLHQRVAQSRAPMFQQSVTDSDPSGEAAREVLALADEVRKAMKL